MVSEKKIRRVIPMSSFKVPTDYQQIPCRMCGERKEEVDYDKGVTLCKECSDKVWLRRYAKMLSISQIPQRFWDESLETYICETDKQKHALSLVKNYLEGAISGKENNLILVGSVGTGKTHLATSLCLEMLDNRFQSYYCNFKFATTSIKSNWDDSTVKESLFNLPFIVIDEIVLKSERMTEWEKEFLYLVMDHRYGKKLPTVIIANMSPDGIKKEVGERTWSRLTENAEIVDMRWEDYRGKKQ